MSWKTRTRSTVSAAISWSRLDRRTPASWVSRRKFLHAGLGPGGLFDLLLLHEHLRGGLEALVLEQALDQFAARVFGVVPPATSEGSRGSSILLLDVDQQRGHVDELAGGVDVGLLEVVGVLEELAVMRAMGMS